MFTISVRLRIIADCNRPACGVEAIAAFRFRRPFLFVRFPLDAEPSLIEKIEECLGQLLRSNPDNSSKRKAELKSVLNEKRFKIRNLTEELAIGNRSEAIREKLAELEKEEAAVQAEIASLVYSDQSDQLFRSNPTVYRSEATMV